MPKYLDRAGHRYGRWTVLRRSTNRKKILRYLCRCDCGTEKLVFATGLCSGRSVSCGCLKIEKLITHGCSGRKYTSLTREYSVWKSMIERCTNPKHIQYHRYGGRGIRVCKRWLKFENFLKDMGLRPDGASIDRINNNKGYCKSNCRWATTLEQMNNTSNSVFITFKGKRKTLADWARYLEVPYYKVAHSKNRLQFIKENFKC